MIFLSRIHISSEYLQDVKADMTDSIILIEYTKKYVFKIEIPNRINDFMMKQQIFKKNCNTTLPFVKVDRKRIRKRPKGLNKFVCENITMGKQIPTEENEFSENLKYFIVF